MKILCCTGEHCQMGKRPMLWQRIRLGAFLLATTLTPVSSRGGNLHGADYMDCGSAALCGVLVLESGYGSGNYAHDKPSVHGLWPETSDFGSSECIEPSSSSDEPSEIYDCYDDLSFEQHECKIRESGA